MTITHIPLVETDDVKDEHTPNAIEMSREELVISAQSTLHIHMGYQPLLLLQGNLLGFFPSVEYADKK